MRPSDCPSSASRGVNSTSDTLRITRRWNRREESLDISRERDIIQVEVHDGTQTKPTGRLHDTPPASRYSMATASLAAGHTQLTNTAGRPPLRHAGAVGLSPRLPL